MNKSFLIISPEAANTCDRKTGNLLLFIVGHFPIQKKKKGRKKSQGEVSWQVAIFR